MKTKLTALALATATLFSLTPKPAAANDKGLAIVGGFIGGLMVASALHDTHQNPPPLNCPMVVVNDRGNYREEGCWQMVTVQVWVPAHWIVERTHHGRTIQRYVGAGYENRTERRWVAYDRHERHDRHEREVGYGYGRR